MVVLVVRAARQPVGAQKLYLHVFFWFKLQRLFQTEKFTDELDGSACWLIWCVFLPQAQYILIHQALLEHTQFGETESPLQELHSTLNTLKQRSSDNESTLMEEEFDVGNFFLTTRLKEEV